MVSFQSIKHSFEERKMKLQLYLHRMHNELENESMEHSTFRGQYEGFSCVYVLYRELYLRMWLTKRLLDRKVNHF